MINESDGHINYYLEHNISPVNYNIDLNYLLDQRKSLYRGLGITPLTIINKNILREDQGVIQILRENAENLSFYTNRFMIIRYE